MMRREVGRTMDLTLEYQKAYYKMKEVLDEVKKLVHGKDDCVEKALSAIMARGHILLEDVPGVGKTTLAVAFSKVMDLNNHRVQFTPDVQPSDLLGFSIYNKEIGSFNYKPGPVLCNLFLADEINRTSPKTQSALLEVMEERMVTVDGCSHKVPDPFIVIATQNPKGSAGTQLLPEAQLDRFMISMSMGYPDLENEIAIAKGKSTSINEVQVNCVLRSSELLYLQELVDRIHVHDNIYKYIAKLVRATRENQYIELGISPRGTIACTKMAKARAFTMGRNYVIPEDVVHVYKDVARHRIMLNTKARVSHVKEDAVLEQILQEIGQPTSYMKRADYRG